MKNFKVYLSSLILVFALVNELRSQDYTYLYVNYNPSFSTGDVKDFVNEFSWRGFSADLRVAIDGGLTAGIYSGWTVLREESDGPVSEVIERGEAALTITANQYRFVNLIPLLGTVHYHFGKFGDVRPYVGLGTGVYFTTRAVEMGLYRLEQKETHFGLAPMLGVSVPINRDANFNFNAIYNQAFETKDVGGVSTIGFNVGIGWRFY